MMPIAYIKTNCKLSVSEKSHMDIIQGTLRLGDHLAIINGGKYYPLGMVSDIIIDGVGTVASATNKIGSLYVMVNTGVNIGMHIDKDTVLWVVIPINVKCVLDVYPSDTGTFLKITGGSFDIGDELTTINDSQLVSHGKINSITITAIKPWEDMMFMVNLENDNKLDAVCEQAVVLSKNPSKCILEVIKNDVDRKYYVRILKGTLSNGDILASNTAVLGRVIDIQLHGNSLTSVHRISVPLNVKLSTGVLIGAGMDTLVVME